MFCGWERRQNEAVLVWGRASHRPACGEFRRDLGHGQNPRTDRRRSETGGSRAEADWNKWEHFRACFADHTPTEEVGAELAAMDTARQERETADFAASCARAAKMVQAVGDAHALCWWNLL